MLEIRVSLFCSYYGFETSVFVPTYCDFCPDLFPRRLPPPRELQARSEQEKQ